MKYNSSAKENILKDILIVNTEKPHKSDPDQRLWSFKHRIGGQEIRGLKIISRTREKTFNF